MTGSSRGWDGARQAANVVGAVTQIAFGGVGTWLAGVDVAQISNDNRTLVTPASYAFAIWGPIFAFSLAYAAYQALPGQRQNPLLRRIGWWTAGGFLCSSLWELVFPFRQYLLAELLIVGAAVGMAGAFVGYARHLRERREPLVGRAARWVIGPTLGLYFGWITAANVVSLAVTLVALDRLNGGAPEAALGSGLLLGLGLVAAAVVRIGKGASPILWVSYGLAVLWALAAVAINQRDASTATTVAAVGAVVPVLAALVVRRPSAGVGRRPAPAPTAPPAPAA